MLSSSPPSASTPLVLSINHNWINSYNLVASLSALLSDLDACERAIADVKLLLLQAGGASWESSTLR